MATRCEECAYFVYDDEYEEYLGGPIRNDINRNISTKMALWPTLLSALHTPVLVTRDTWRSVLIPPPRTTIFIGQIPFTSDLYHLHFIKAYHLEYHIS